LFLGLPGCSKVKKRRTADYSPAKNVIKTKASRPYERKDDLGRQRPAGLEARPSRAQGRLFFQDIANLWGLKAHGKLVRRKTGMRFQNESRIAWSFVPTFHQRLLGDVVKGAYFPGAFIRARVFPAVGGKTAVFEGH